MTNFAFRRHSRNPRAALLGAVAAVALGASLFGLVPARPALAEAPLAQLAPASGPASFADVVERVKGAVVAIKVKAVETANNDSEDGPELSPDDPLYDFFKRFGQGRGGMPQKHVTQSQGSGFIISADGYVVTNNHVVEHASEVEVVLDGGKTLPAKIIGTDKRTDLALLKINDGGNLPFVDMVERRAARRRLGDRGRQSVRPRRNGDGGHRLGARPRHRRRAVRRLFADRRAGQSRQLGRSGV